MMKMKAVSNYMKTLVIAMFFLVPTNALAASPKGSIQNVIDGFMELLLYLAPSVAALALIWYGLQYHFAGESHDKANLKGNMKGTLIISVLICIAAGTVRWIFSMAS